MGNTISRTAAESRISKALPPIHEWTLLEHEPYPTLDFESGKEKRRFVDGILALAEANGQTHLEHHDFVFHYTRNANGRIVASLLAIKNGKIDAKVSADEDGEDEIVACRAFKADIERRMQGLVRDAPNAFGEPSEVGAGLPPAYSGPGVAEGGVKTEVTSDAPNAFGEPSEVGADLPPAYSGPGVAEGDMKTEVTSDARED